jgi:hypothetical protein
LRSAGKFGSERLSAVTPWVAQQVDSLAALAVLGRDLEDDCNELDGRGPVK